MEAKDTVMSDEQILDAMRATIKIVTSDDLSGVDKCDRLIAQAQAPISFKAGEKSGYNKGYAQAEEDLAFLVLELGLDKEIKQTGIQEVVKWIDEHFTEYAWMGTGDWRQIKKRGGYNGQP